ncbi:hypothetical protein, partial [Nitrobacter sp.]|uniref:hypothetical protein n=1 Tax=Nitrobacter sp. TaxID=29420 RepID=UPI003F6519FF
MEWTARANEIAVEDFLTGPGIGQFSLQPQFDAAGAQQGRRHLVGVHRGQDHRNLAGGFRWGFFRPRRASQAKPLAPGWGTILLPLGVERPFENRAKNAGDARNLLRSRKRRNTSAPLTLRNNDL